jgi:hypothetical protein
VTVYDKSSGGNVVCQIADERSTIISDQVIDLSSCALSETMTYYVSVNDPAVPADNLLIDGDNDDIGSAALPFAYSKGQWGPAGSGKPMILYDVNPQNSSYAKGIVNAGNNSNQCGNEESPLIISTAAVQKMPKLDLTSPSNGVFFNLLGENALPVANAPVQISWFQNLNYGFLVLPDGQGQVNGINQLFGNNTLGPDGKFAANGFAALAKYDVSGTGMISSRDPVFANLRVWIDANYDGVAQPSELHPLNELGIAEINLGYNSHFQETDQYGNQIKDKSTAIDQDGSAHLVFDLWFKVFGE